MQKLNFIYETIKRGVAPSYNRKIKKMFFGESGSTLLGAITLCAVMSIGIAGLMGVARNTTGMEVDSYNDARAFLAAEGGLNMLTNWVTQAGATSVTNDTYKIPGGVNGVDVTVTISDPPTGTGPDGTLRLLSATADIPELPYTKTIEWVIDMLVPIPKPREPAYYGAVVSSNISQAIQNQQFKGPIHFNAPINLGNFAAGTTPLRFEGGPVTVHISANEPTHGLYQSNGRLAPLPTGVNTHFNNDYKNQNGGLISHAMGNNETNNLNSLNNVFNCAFRYDADFLRVTMDQTLSTRVIRINSGAGAAGAPLPNGAMNALSFGGSSDNNRYIILNGVQYNYTRNERIIFEVDGPVNVTGNGKMLGNVTVETTTGNAITLDLTSAGSDHIMYDWPGFVPQFDNSSKRLTDASYENFHTIAESPQPAGRTDVLAFYSGADILLKTGSQNGYVVTAQLFATNPGHTIRPAPGFENGKGISLIGTVSSDMYWPTGSNLTVFNGHFHDRRTIGAPGVTLVDSDGNLVIVGNEVDDDADDGSLTTILPKFNWREYNTARM